MEHLRRNVYRAQDVLTNDTEADTQRCSSEKVCWKYAAKLQDNTHAEVQFQ